MIVETTAGMGSGFPDENMFASARKSSDWGRGVRASRDDREGEGAAGGERKRLKRGQILFTYLHLAPDPEQTRDLMASGATCIAYETVTSRTADCRC